MSNKAKSPLPLPPNFALDPVLMAELQQDFRAMAVNPDADILPLPMPLYVSLVKSRPDNGDELEFLNLDGLL
ncbi:hypothetical protein [Pseudomonas sp. WS 5011]|jgi:hypothetical protein|uniref:hypothetical protein n=1 Tax=Pseudomonas sp. WS 5011 TaxID=2717477 RepID=UPI001476552C|nr:hypothetical protein [Pseudomonas sp. WS 5011]NMY53495.1 hypothetical protein [Pseudomonas sp. WS 5011]